MTGKRVQIYIPADLIEQWEKLPRYERSAEVAKSLRQLWGDNAILAERERCAQIAESFIPSGFTGEGKVGNSYAVARDDRARVIAAAIRGSAVGSVVGSERQTAAKRDEN